MLSRKEEKGDEFLSRFIYPLIGLVTVAAFLGVLFTRKEFDVELALKSSIKTLVASFGGFYLGAYLLNEAWQGLFKREKDMKLCQRFVGYSSSLMFALNVIPGLPRLGYDGYNPFNYLLVHLSVFLFECILPIPSIYLFFLIPSCC